MSPYHTSDGSRRRSMIPTLLLTFVVVLALLNVLGAVTVHAAGKDVGRIAGTIVDAETGEPLIGASVYLEGTDLDGHFVIKDTLDSDAYGEHDGAVSPEDQAPFATPLLSNVTAIGVVGQGPIGASINAQCFNIRDNAGGGYFNSIFAYHKGFGVLVEDAGGAIDSRQRLSVTDLHFENNMFWGQGGALNDPGEVINIGDLTALIAYLYIAPNTAPAACQ